jgi:hypothetical protein
MSRFQPGEIPMYTPPNKLYPEKSPLMPRECGCGKLEGPLVLAEDCWRMTGYSSAIGLWKSRRLLGS